MPGSWQSQDDMQGPWRLEKSQVGKLSSKGQERNLNELSALHTL
jgi:hypothetical protein